MIDAEYLISHGTFIQLPFNGEYLDYSKYNSDITKFPIEDDSTYKTWALNAHHFKPFYHIKHTLPILNMMFDFGFDLSHFDNIKRTSKDGYDISYLKPKNNFLFNVYWYTRNEVTILVNYDFLISCNLEKREKDGIGNVTEYHAQYRYPHSCSRIVNNTIDNNRILFISGDSQFIPIVPVLACYFKEVWMYDNRNNGHYLERLENTNVTDILFETGATNYTKYIKNNLL